MSVYEKLAKIQSELFVPKGQKNNFGNYNYRSCEDILKVVKPLCEKNKCVLMLTNDVIDSNGKNYMKTIASLIDLETGEAITSTAMAREDDNAKGQSPSQQSGSSISYSRKYCLAGMFCIDNERDADATNTHGKDMKVTSDDCNTILLGIAKVGMTAEELCKKYGVKEISDLTQDQYLSIRKEINDLYEANKKKEKEKK